MLLHGTHPHVETPADRRARRFTPRTDHDADSYYEVTLTATDSGGLTGTRTITLRPETVPLTHRQHARRRAGLAGPGPP